MGQRGPRSGADIALAAQSNVVSIERPRAPAELTEEQAEQWDKIVSAMPADWFPPGSHGTLIQLCRHRIRSRRLAQLLDALEQQPDFDVAEYRGLVRSEGENTRLIESCETKLRLTPQSQYDKSKKRGTQTRAPWKK